MHTDEHGLMRNRGGWDKAWAAGAERFAEGRGRREGRNFRGWFVAGARG